MITPGLVSVTFRQLEPSQITALVARAGLTVIEWGGDIHVPHGDKARARKVLAMTRDAGLQVASYGSYYNLGSREGPSFEAVADTAAELKAPVIRVWAGERGSSEADETYWKLIVEDSRRIADLARSAGMLTAFEFHHGTLTDTAASARRLLERSDHPAVRSYWQPSTALDRKANEAELSEVLGWLLNVHVYHIGPDQRERLPLAEGAAWPCFLAMLAATRRDHCAMLEFVRDDSPEAFLRDAETLMKWVAAANAGQSAPNRESV